MCSNCKLFTLPPSIQLTIISHLSFIDSLEKNVAETGWNCESCVRAAFQSAADNVRKKEGDCRKRNWKLRSDDNYLWFRRSYRIANGNRDAFDSLELPVKIEFFPVWNSLASLMKIANIREQFRRLWGRNQNGSFHETLLAHPRDDWMSLNSRIMPHIIQ